MEHDHEYLHAHHIPHGHGHDHGADRAEAEALLKYMAEHNAAHARELLQLAERLQSLGEAAACEQVRRAAEDFEAGGRRLADALTALSDGNQ